MTARPSQASHSLPRSRTPLDSSQFSQRTSSNTLKNSTSIHYQTPKKSIKPPSLTSLLIRQYRKPQVRFARSTEKVRTSRFDGRWEEEEAWSDESSSTLEDDDDELMRLLEIGDGEKRGVSLQVDRVHRRRVQKCSSRLKRGSLQSAPIIDHKAFSRVTSRSESRSFRIVKTLSEDSVNALTNVLESYSSVAIAHQVYLQNDKGKLVQLLAKSKDLLGAVETLRSINAKLVASKLETKTQLTKIRLTWSSTATFLVASTDLATQAELSRVAKLWEEARPQYFTALQAASGPPARSCSKGTGGIGGDGIEAMLMSLLGGETREEPDRSEQATSKKGRRHLA